jgi:hypothetical protein
LTGQYILLDFADIVLGISKNFFERRGDTIEFHHEFFVELDHCGPHISHQLVHLITSQDEIL